MIPSPQSHSTPGLAVKEEQSTYDSDSNYHSYPLRRIPRIAPVSTYAASISSLVHHTQSQSRHRRSARRKGTRFAGHNWIRHGDSVRDGNSVSSATAYGRRLRRRASRLLVLRLRHAKPLGDLHAISKVNRSDSCPGSASHSRQSRVSSGRLGGDVRVGVGRGERYRRGICSVKGTSLPSAFALHFVDAPGCWRVQY